MSNLNKNNASMERIITPDWPAPKQVKAYFSTRLGGISHPPYDCLNLGDHVQDKPDNVIANRQTFANAINLPVNLRWLYQVHGTHVAELPSKEEGDLPADAAFSKTLGQVCAVMVADCLPLLLCDPKRGEVAACHAGWRGLCAGVIEACVAKFSVPQDVMVWLGPAIGPKSFEVGSEVREAFIQQQAEAEMAFTQGAEQDKSQDKWLADLYLLARQRLASCGIQQIYGGDFCTYTDKERFFSYRRDGVTGRMAGVIWIEERF